jgi:hypothetical protein
MPVWEKSLEWVQCNRREWERGERKREEERIKKKVKNLLSFVWLSLALCWDMPFNTQAIHSSVLPFIS